VRDWLRYGAAPWLRGNLWNVLVVGALVGAVVLQGYFQYRLGNAHGFVEGMREQIQIQTEEARRRGIREGVEWATEFCAVEVFVGGCRCAWREAGEVGLLPEPAEEIGKAMSDMVGEFAEEMVTR